LVHWLEKWCRVGGKRLVCVSIMCEPQEDVQEHNHDTRKILKSVFSAIHML
jgi:hypothetical protein